MFEGIRTPRENGKLTANVEGEVMGGGQMPETPSILKLAKAGNVHRDDLIKASYAQERASTGSGVRRAVEIGLPFEEVNFNHSDETQGVPEEIELPLPQASYSDGTSIELTSLSGTAGINHDIVQAFDRKSSQAFGRWASESIKKFEEGRMGELDLEPRDVPSEVLIGMVRLAAQGALKEPLVEVAALDPLEGLLDNPYLSSTGVEQTKEAFRDDALEALKEKYPPGTLFTITSTTGEVIDAVVRSHDRDVSSGDLVIRALYLNEDGQVKLIKIFDPKPKDAIKNAVGNPRDLDEVKKFLSGVRKDKKELAERRRRINAMSERVDKDMAAEDEVEVPMDDM